MEIIEVENKSLDEWLDMVFNPPKGKMFVQIAFPTEKHKEEFIKTIDKRTEGNIKKLLFVFLVKTGTLTSDELDFKSLLATKNYDTKKFKEMLENQFFRRLTLFALKKSKIPPWEGITWILDLLPHYPKIALEGLNAYLMAHIQILPDWQLHGLFDALEIIRAKYIGIPNSKNKYIKFLQSLSSREFECLIERLYNSRGYKTELTAPQKDGGRDVIAKKENIGQLEKLLIECKKYTNPVGVEIIRGLYGVVADEKVNKGVIVTTDKFTKGAKDFARRNSVELISGAELIPLLNEHLGSRWYLHIDRYVIEAENVKKK